jgi:hypothetical protein
MMAVMMADDYTVDCPQDVEHEPGGTHGCVVGVWVGLVVGCWEGVRVGYKGLSDHHDDDDGNKGPTAHTLPDQQARNQREKGGKRA